jgi:VWFA-related protein
MFFRSTLLIFCAALLASAGALAQAQSKPDGSKAPTRQGYVIHAETRLVQVEVIAQDKKGSPILGLKQEDFTILDGNKPQKIAFFAANAPTPTAPHPLPANVFTNRSDLKGEQPGATIVILFDALNTSFFDQAYARQHIQRFLRSVKPQDRVAIFALTTQLIPLHDFSQDIASLQSSVDRFSPRLLASFDASHPSNFPAAAGDPSGASMQNHFRNATGEISDFHTINRFRITYAAVVDIANYVADIPGRKSLIWVSDGIPIQIGSNRIGVPDRDNLRFAGGIDDLTRLLNRANMAIYPVDAQGVDIKDSGPAFFTRQNLRDSFRLLADNTGGKAFYGTNDVAGAIESAVEDGRYTYTIGYYPDHGVWDGKFREIKIKTSVPDSNLRYRRGYFALPNHDAGEAVSKMDLAEAAHSPLEATALGVSVTGKTLEPASARTLQLQVTLDPKQFLLHDQDSHRQGGLDLVFLQKDSTGKFLAADKQHLDVNFTPKEYDFLAKAGLILQRRLGINPAAAEIRIMVRDAASGALGSVSIPVKNFL